MAVLLLVIRRFALSTRNNLDVSFVAVKAPTAKSVQSTKKDFLVPSVILAFTKRPVLTTLNPNPVLSVVT